MTDFISEIEELKDSVRESLRRDIWGAISKVHLTEGISLDLASALACEAVTQVYSRAPNSDSTSAVMMLRWMADEIERNNEIILNQPKDLL